MKLTIPIVCLVNFIKMKTYALFAAASFAQVSKWLRFSWRTFDWILLWLSNEIIFDSSFSSLSLRVFDAKWAKFGIENGSWNLWANDFAPLSLSFTNRNRFILHFYDRNSFHFLYSRKKGNEWQNGTRFGIKLHREFEYLSLWREHSLFRRVFTFCFHRLALFCLDGITCKSQFEMVDDDFRLLRARQPIPWEIGVYEILQGTTPSDWELPLPIRTK